MSDDNGIHLTHCGQSRPYADSVYAGTVTAADEQEARAKLQEMRYCKDPIFDKADRERWSHPYFTEFKLEEPGKWRFRIIEIYTG